VLGSLECIFHSTHFRSRFFKRLVCPHEIENKD
jgi:hypothetical protein